LFVPVLVAMLLAIPEEQAVDSTHSDSTEVAESVLTPDFPKLAVEVPVGR
jgi:hypothetical protein